MDIYQTALRLLAVREHSRLELQRKLQTRGYPLPAIDTVLTRLAEEHLFSETRFTESYVRSHTARGYGPVRIAIELQQRGINRDLIDQFLGSTTTDWQQVAARVREKRFGRSLPTTITERARQQRFLQYRGFSSEQIKSVLTYDSE